MPVPTQRELHKPILQILNGAEGGAHVEIIKNTVAERFSMTPADLAETLPSGRITRFDDRSKWALSYLKRAGLIDSTSRSNFEITPAGRALLASYRGDTISARQLNELIKRRKRDETYPDEGGARGEDVIEPAASNPVAETSEDIAPHEQMDALHREMNTALEDELLGIVKGLPPLRFERLVVNLLEAMGYGEGLHVGGSGDQGIDGVINQDPLGLEKVYIQAKRWQGAVGEPEIRIFAGSLDMKGANKGVFITTSAFSQSAKNSAASSARTIRLIDGGELATLMIRHNVGVITEITYALKKPDENYFSDDA